jgi:hypothetical protein
MDTLLRQLVNRQEKRPFHETATASEWVTAFQEWAASHRHNAPPLSDYAVSRESMYEDENFQNKDRWAPLNPPLQMYTSPSTIKRRPIRECHRWTNFFV